MARRKQQRFSILVILILLSTSLLLLINLLFTPTSYLCPKTPNPTIKFCNPLKYIIHHIKKIKSPSKYPAQISNNQNNNCSFAQTIKNLQQKTCKNEKISTTKVPKLKIAYYNIFNEPISTEILRKIGNSSKILRIISEVRQSLKLDNVPKIVNPLPWHSTNLAIKSLKLKNDVTEEFQQMSNLLNITVSMANFLFSNVLSNAVIPTPEMTEFLATRDERREAVFFTETSGSGVIKARFLCAVESAARAYPNGDIYLIIAYLPEYGLLKIANEELNIVLDKYPNIHVLKVDMDKLFLSSPLEPFYRSGVLKSSQYLAAHTSDVIRILIVWKYGGKYFDLDIITIKNLTHINQFVIQEANFSDNNIANGAFGYKKFSPVGNYMFKILNAEFQKDEWTGNGPRILTLAMRNYTGSGTVTGMNEKNLKEFKKLKYETLFPIEFYELGLYFNASVGDAVMERLSKVEGLWGLHIGNNLAKNLMVNVGSNQAYGRIAEKYCPRSYWSAHGVF